MQTSTKSLLVLLIGVTCVLQTTALVCPYNSTLCACIDDAVSCDRLESIPPLTIGYNQSGFTHVEFKAGNITSIPKGSLPAGLESFYLSGHPLTNISDDAFDNSATTLQEVHFIGAAFKQLPRALLKLTNLQEMYIADTPLESIEISILQHIGKTLTSLTLRNIGLSAWPSWMSYLHILSVVYLDGNSVKSVPDNAFSSFSDTLTSLSLVGTGLTKVPKVLSTLSNLTRLDLSNNRFTDVSELETVFPVGSKLARLTINSVGLTRILNFSNMTNLNEINLNNNNISDPSAGSFPPSVTKLYLADCHLSSVPTALANLARLSASDMSTNKTLTVPSRLDKLDLSYNQITKINPGDFPPALSNLNLRFNQISEIASNNFPSSLTVLDLSNNNLNNITNTTFSKLTLLTTLSLNNNPISIISVSAFADLKSLRELYLESTSLPEIPLALVDLPIAKARVYMGNIPSMSCPCPPPTKLVSWAKDYNHVFGNCTNQYTIEGYFVSLCATTSPSVITTPSDNSPAVGFSLFSICGALLCVFIYKSLW